MFFLKKRYKIIDNYLKSEGTTFKIIMYTVLYPRVGTTFFLVEKKVVLLQRESSSYMKLLTTRSEDDFIAVGCFKTHLFPL